MSKRKFLTVLLLGMLFTTGGSFSGTSGESSTKPAVSPDGYSGEPVSLKLVNVSLVDFFRAISELSGLNILIDPDVSGTITINVEQVPWDQLFDAVLHSHGLVKTIRGNLVRIATKDTLKLD